MQDAVDVNAFSTNFPLEMLWRDYSPQLPTLKDHFKISTFLFTSFETTLKSQQGISVWMRHFYIRTCSGEVNWMQNPHCVGKRQSQISAFRTEPHSCWAQLISSSLGSWHKAAAWAEEECRSSRTEIRTCLSYFHDLHCNPSRMVRFTGSPLHPLGHAPGKHRG